MKTRTSRHTFAVIFSHLDQIMKNLFSTLVLGMAALCMTGMGHAADKSSKEDAVAMIKSAVSSFKKNGRDATLQELGTQQEGKFRKGDLFVVAMDQSGMILGHTAILKMIGVNISEMRDINGVYMVKDILEKAKKADSGWSVQYMFPNPSNQKMAPKVSYFQKVDDLILFCGIYQ